MHCRSPATSARPSPSPAPFGAFTAARGDSPPRAAPDRRGNSPPSAFPHFINIAVQRGQLSVGQRLQLQRRGGIDFSGLFRRGDDAAGGQLEINDGFPGADHLRRQISHQGDDFDNAHGLFSLRLGDERPKFPEQGQRLGQRRPLRVTGAERFDSRFRPVQRIGTLIGATIALNDVARSA